MRIRYIGRRPREVSPVRGREFHIEPGEVVEVDDVVGESLLLQPVWFEQEKPKSTSKAGKSADTEGND